MIAADAQALLVNPLFWVALAVGILVVEVLVVSGASLAVGLAGLLVGIGLLMFPTATPTSAEVARLVTTAAAVWSLASLLVVLALRFWFRRQRRRRTRTTIQRRSASRGAARKRSSCRGRGTRTCYAITNPAWTSVLSWKFV